ncbi:MAG: septation protein SepH [Candidatus Nanopelagicales bacterium]
MRELRYEGLSEDGTHLVLEDGRGVQYTVAVDEAVAAAVRRAIHRTSVRQSTGSLTPRDIQALIRQGVSVDEVAAQTDLALDFVERFAEPVMAEMDFVIQRARRLSVHSAGQQILVEDLVDRAARRADVPVEELEWACRKTDESAWRIEALAHGELAIALVFRVSEGTVVPADVATADLLGSRVVDLTETRMPAHWDAEHPAAKAAARSAAARPTVTAAPLPDDPSRIF